MSETDIEVKVQDGVLLLSGKRESKKEEKNEGAAAPDAGEHELNKWHRKTSPADR